MKNLFGGLIFSLVSLTMMAQNGTVQMGSNSYNSITSAYAAISTPMTGPVVIELLSGYSGSKETWPITLAAKSGASATNTITIRPASAGLSITVGTATPSGTVNINGGKYIIFDGRVNGTGTTADLVIQNTYLSVLSSSSKYAIQFINDACNNTIKYCNVKGRTTSGTNGVIQFSTTTGTTGNDNNLIDNCNIGYVTSTPVNAVYSTGSTTSTGTYNSGNTISNCLIHDFYQDLSGGAYPIGIYLGSGNTGWTLSENSLYQTTPRSPTYLVGYHGIFISGGEGYTITGNYIGGSSANCGGTPWTVNGNGTPPTIANFFYPIRFGSSMPAITANSIQGNVISNISLYTNPDANSLYFTGILIPSGICNVGNISPNTIGNTTGNGSITITVGAGSYSTYIMGIDYAGPSGTIQNNQIGSFTLNGNAGSGYPLLFMGIDFEPYAQSGDVTITGNTIGSASTTGSIQCPSAAGPPTDIIGISTFPSGAAGTLTVSGNIVANINNLSSSSYSYLCGILSDGTDIPATISMNTIRDLNTACQNASTDRYSALSGIASLTVKPGQLISQNTIYNLVNSDPTSAVSVNGIYINASESSIRCSRNFIHSLSVSSTSTDAILNGILISAPSTNGVYENNMIRLGIKGDGNPLQAGCMINGILEQACGADSVLFNSIYIGGSVTSGSTGSCFAFNSLVSGNNRVYENNIFYNTRTGGTGGKHYSIKIGGSGVRPLGLTSNFNLFNSNGATFGIYNATEMKFLANWRITSDQDMASAFGDPNFIAPAGNATTVNLHIQNPTPVEHSGLAIAGVTHDFDGDTRSALTPTDIGADAGNFTVSADIFGPNIVYTPLGNTMATSNRILTNFAVITDNTGVSSGLSNPRIYYKKSTDNDDFTQPNTSAGNGWKYAIASGSGPYSFVLDYSIIYGGSVATGDVIEYFVAAQDDAFNLSSEFQGAAKGTNPPIQNIAGSPPQLYTYTIGNSISGTITIPGAYTSLTRSDGFFAALNSGVMTGNTTVLIAGDLTNEDGSVALHKWSEEPANSNFKLRILPGSTTQRVISGSVDDKPMISIEGADRFVIEGTGGKYLTIRNTSSTASSAGPAMAFSGHCSNDSVNNCILESNSLAANSGTVLLGGSGINNVVISGNEIREARGGTAGSPYNAVYAGYSAGPFRLVNNNIYNWLSSGVHLEDVSNGTIISGNSFYYNTGTPATSEQYAIYVGSGNGHSISGNYIGGQSPHCGGSPWTNSADSMFFPIYLTVGNGTATSVQGNIIQNISLTSTGSNASFYGINLYSGLANIGTETGNLIGDPATAGSIAFNGTGVSGYFAVIGINVTSTNPNNNVENNCISNINLTAASGSPAATGFYIYSANVRRNKVTMIGATNAALTPEIDGIFNNGPAVSTLEYSNNMIVLNGGSATNPDISGFIDVSSYPSTYNFFNNSISISGAAMTTAYTHTFWRIYDSWLNLKNNIFSNTRVTGGTGYNIVIRSQTADSWSCDYNDFWATGNNFVWDNTLYTSFTSWQTNSGGDAHSLNVNPPFVSSSDLHIASSSSLDGKGITIAGQTLDIDGLTRNNPPDMGINEFTGTTTKIWTGVVSTDWNTSGNWNGGTVPVGTENIVIPWTAIRQPAINTTGSSVNNLTLGQFTSLSVNAGKDMTINGNLTLINRSSCNNLGTITLKGNLDNQNGQ
jgi:hypothetical protein